MMNSELKKPLALRDLARFGMVFTPSVEENTLKIPLRATTGGEN